MYRYLILLLLAALFGGCAEHSVSDHSDSQLPQRHIHHSPRM
jgi:hypothetical protein